MSLYQPVPSTLTVIPPVLAVAVRLVGAPGFFAPVPGFVALRAISSSEKALLLTAFSVAVDRLQPEIVRRGTSTALYVCTPSSPPTVCAV